jgi:hypothetical protein
MQIVPITSRAIHQQLKAIVCAVLIPLLRECRYVDFIPSELQQLTRRAEL